MLRIFLLLICLDSLFACPFSSDDPLVSISSESIMGDYARVTVRATDPAAKIIIDCPDRRHFRVRTQIKPHWPEKMVDFYKTHKERGFYESAVPSTHPKAFFAPYATEFYGEKLSASTTIPGHIMAPRAALYGLFVATDERLPLRIVSTHSPSLLCISECALRPDASFGAPPLFYARGFLNFSAHRALPVGSSESFSCCESLLQSRPFECFGAILTFTCELPPVPLPPSLLPAPSEEPKQESSSLD